MVGFAIAEDEAIEAKALTRFIETRFPDARVLWTAPDGLKALERAAEEPPDVLIVDINMPGLDGLTLCERLAERSFAGVLVINTAYDDFAYAQRAVRFGATDYLLKPSGGEELYAALNRAREKAIALRGGRMAEPNIRRYSEAYLFEHLLSGTGETPFGEFGWPDGPMQTVASVLSADNVRG